ncbi:hypothetical protein BsWGS_18653 [Bradybaena similaris]
MEGVLLKWTNYFSGWQPRWFILDNGVLSYYRSQEDVNNGCKGSIKMAVCDIAVHPTDMTRLDLTIPGEQYYYVKASTAQERQSWLIALGSSKAAFHEASSAKQSADALPDLIRSKQSELRLYCDLLMQQVHYIKQMVSRSDGVLDIEKMTESSSLIAATCDTFIVALNECMTIVSDSPAFHPSQHHAHDVATQGSSSLASIQRMQSARTVIARPVERSARRRPPSISSLESIKVHTSSSHHSHTDGSSPKWPASPAVLSPVLSHSSLQPEPVHYFSTPSIEARQASDPLSSTPLSSLPATDVNLTEMQFVSDSKPLLHDSNGSLLKDVHELVIPTEPASAASDLDVNNSKDDENIATFFSAMPSSFADVDTSEDSILVVPFLDACKHLVPIFDKLNTSALIPVKMDFCGNIKKIESKYESNPEQFSTLQSMVLHEVENNQQTHSNSATSALLWLKRSLEFIAEFLKECCSGCTDMGICAGNAYSRTLKLYHGWVVRGVFAVAVRALPYRETFISHLSVDGTTTVDTSSERFEQVLLADIKTFLLQLTRVLDAINDFYARHSLDSPDTV